MTKLSAKLAWGFLGSILITNLSVAGSNHAFLKGGDLIQYCISQDPRSLAFCEGYILGINDTIVAGYLKDQIGICYPNGLKPSDLRVTVVEWLTKNPPLQSYIAEGPVAEALSERYRCENPPQN